MTEDIVFVQSFFLTANETPSLPDAKRICPSTFCNSWRNLIRVTFTLASLGLAVTDSVDVIMFSLGEEDVTKTPSVIALAHLLWRSFFTARGVIVLALFFCRLPQWRALRAFVVKKTLQPLGHRSAKQSTTFRRISLVLFIISLSLHASHSAFFWLSAEGLLEAPQTDNSSLKLNATSVCFYYSWFDRCIGRSIYASLWTLLVDWPFLLSQQILISGLIFVWSAVKTIRNLRKETVAEKNNLTVSWSQIGTRSLPDRIENWTLTYVNMSRFVEYFNDCFGGILLVSVVLDVLTAMAFFTRLISTPSAFDSLGFIKMFRYGWVGGVFLAYATICYLPFILLHEEVSKEPLSKEVAEKLTALSCFVVKNPLTIEAGGLFNFSRALLVTVMTTVVTTLLLSKEILNRSVVT
ncbi:hypothetical protein BV898_19853 [Hypsibius exemplaris]|uniref:Uncharacterized protein n=1 Tax=Hypsibius exemplaris TaxID=2072580 RepID=A0A9X6NRR4_HYPEX|nr:hypothetical protein BV898_19853 [Hypsibius exemplaris]